MGSLLTAGNDDVENELSEINEQVAKWTEISGQDINNRNNETYAEAVSSQLQATILSDIEINSKIRSLNFKQRQIFDLYLIGLSYRSKLSLGLLQISQSHFICFSQAVEAVVNHI